LRLEGLYWRTGVDLARRKTGRFKRADSGGGCGGVGENLFGEGGGDPEFEFGGSPVGSCAGDAGVVIMMGGENLLFVVMVVVVLEESAWLAGGSTIF